MHKLHVKIGFLFETSAALRKTSTAWNLAIQHGPAAYRPKDTLALIFTRRLMIESIDGLAFRPQKEVSNHVD